MFAVRVFCADGVKGLWVKNRDLSSAEHASIYIASKIAKGEGFTLIDPDSLTKIAVPPKYSQERAWCVETFNEVTREVI